MPLALGGLIVPVALAAPPRMRSSSPSSVGVWRRSPSPFEWPGAATWRCAAIVVPIVLSQAGPQGRMTKPERAGQRGNYSRGKKNYKAGRAEMHC